ncbi:MAG: amidohydrolase family protein [Planctomycetota bacterium]
MQRHSGDSWQSFHSGRHELSVRWLLNPDQPPQQNCRLVIEDGVLLAVQPATGADSDGPPLMLVPPLVNAHTHLEFSSLSQPLQPPAPFTDWIRSVIRWRTAEASPGVTDPQRAAIDSGLAESAAQGVQLVGEIATSNPHLPPSKRPRCLFFREVIGLQPDRCQQQLTMLEGFLDLRPQIEAAGGRIGISPHAPYSVHPDLLAQLATTARREHLPLAMHLGETREERELLERGTGLFAEFLRSLDLFDPAVFCGGRTLTDYLEALTLAPHALAIHGNWFDRSEWEYLRRQPTITVVYCPRTHHGFGHPPYPLEEMLAMGVRVVLGTDSRASNPDLGIWHEFQYVLQHYPALDPLPLLSMITTTAAAALGWPEASQALIPGRPFAGTLLECPAQSLSLRQQLRQCRILQTI